MTDFLHEITYEPGDPLYTGTGQIAEEIDYSLPVSLGGRGYLLDRSPSLPMSMRHARASIDLLNTQNASDSDEISSAPPEVWRRTAESWHQGAGQRRFDRRNALPYRFLDSHNVNVWEEWSLSLLNDTEQIQALPAGTAHITTVGPERFVVVVGNQSWWFSDTALAPITLALPSQVLDIASDGANLYTVDTLGNLRKYTGPTAGVIVSAIPNFDPDRAFVGFAKGFVIAAGGQYLYDMTTGAPTLIYQHPLEGFRWVEVCEGLGPAYMLGGIGDKWGVYSMTINEDAATFLPPVGAASIPEGEIGYTIASYLGYILIGTNGGWRFGFPASDGSLTFGKLVETSHPVQCFEGQDRFVWYGQSGSPAGLGRADLSQFTAPMTPAYANDLRTEAVGEVSGVITFASGAENTGKRVFVVSGVGVFAESDNLAESGWVEQGEFTFNSSDLKIGMYLQVSHGPMPNGASLAVQIRYDSSGWVDLGRQDIAESISMGNLPLDVRFHVASVRLVLTRSTVDPSTGPEPQRIELRALNIPGRATEFRLPIMLRSNLYYNERTDLREPEDDYLFLQDLWLSRRPVTYREAGQTYQVNVTDFLWLPEQQTENGSAYEGLMVLTAKEMK